MDKATQERLLANVEKLNEKFRSKLPERLIEIRNCWFEARQNQDDETIQKNLYRKVHSLAGSAGTFGFAEVGVSARQLLNTIKVWQSDAGANTGTNTDTGKALIDEVETKMEAFEQVVRTACNQI